MRSWCKLLELAAEFAVLAMHLEKFGAACECGFLVGIFEMGQMAAENLLKCFPIVSRMAAGRGRDRIA
jgi:hypothetical protein